MAVKKINKLINKKIAQTSKARSSAGNGFVKPDFVIFIGVD